MRQLAPHHVHKGDLAHADANTVEVPDQSLAAGKTIQNYPTQVLNSVRQFYLKQKEMLITKLRKITVVSTSTSTGWLN